MESTRRTLYIIGLGVKIPGHRTVEAAHALARYERIYSIVGEAPGLWLPPGLASKIDVRSLLELYEEGALRTGNYDRVAAEILTGFDEAAVIEYVTYGNPFAYDAVAQRLARSVPERGITLRVTRQRAVTIRSCSHPKTQPCISISPFRDAGSAFVPASYSCRRPGANSPTGTRWHGSS